MIYVIKIAFRSYLGDLNVGVLFKIFKFIKRPLRPFRCEINNHIPPTAFSLVKTVTTHTQALQNL